MSADDSSVGTEHPVAVTVGDVSPGSAADAAIALVTRTGSAGDALGDRARKLRRRALIWVCVAVLAFLIRSVTAMMLTAWRQTGFPDATLDTDLMVRLTNKSLPVIVWSTRLATFVAILGVVAYAIEHVRFRSLWLQLPLEPSARERHVRINAAAFATAMLMAVIGAGIYVTGELLPPKPGPQEHYRMLRDAQKVGGLQHLLESEQNRTIPMYIERAGAESLWNLHVLILPAAWAGLILVLLIPVYSLQRARIAPEDMAVTPYANPPDGSSDPSGQSAATATPTS